MIWSNYNTKKMVIRHAKGNLQVTYKLSNGGTRAAAKERTGMD